MTPKKLEPKSRYAEYDTDGEGIVSDEELARHQEMLQLELQEETVVCINRVSKATTGGRAMRFNSLVVVGDGKGHVGLGFGKANEVASAVNKARENAKKNHFQS